MAQLQEMDGHGHFHPPEACLCIACRQVAWKTMGNGNGIRSSYPRLLVMSKPFIFTQNRLREKSLSRLNETSFNLVRLTGHIPGCALKYGEGTVG